MSSSHFSPLLHIFHGRKSKLCGALTPDSFSVMVCSLPDTAHSVHQFLDEDTGEVLVEWVHPSAHTATDSNHRRVA